MARKWLTDTFGNRWIGRSGGLEWPPRSPDLTPPDFFLWGVIKKAVYSTKPRSLEEMKERITNAFYSITPELCHKVCSSRENRVLKCIEVNGRQFEYLQIKISFIIHYITVNTYKHLIYIKKLHFWYCPQTSGPPCIWHTMFKYSSWKLRNTSRQLFVRLSTFATFAKSQQHCSSF